MCCRENGSRSSRARFDGKQYNDKQLTKYLGVYQKQSESREKYCSSVLSCSAKSPGISNSVDLVICVDSLYREITAASKCLLQ